MCEHIVVWTSPDGLQWGDATYGTIWTSPDGTDWTQSAETQPLGDELHAVHFDGTKHLVVGKTGEDTVLYTNAADTSR